MKMRFVLMVYIYLAFMCSNLGCSGTDPDPSRKDEEGNGLTGTYYNEADFTDEALVRVDSTVNFDWHGGSPDESIGNDTFSVRWEGFVQPEYSDTYTFQTRSDDGVRLWVDGDLVIDNWTVHPPTIDTGTIALEAGQYYEITLEFYENYGGAVMELSWSCSSQPLQIIPASRLFTENPDDDGGDGDADGDSDGDSDGDGDGDGDGDLPAGLYSTVISLPDGEPTACEQEWTIRMLHYHPGAVVPRRMYFDTCNQRSSEPSLWISLTVGENRRHPEPDLSSGVVLRAVLNSATGQFEVVDQRRFDECQVMEGIAASEDCSTVGVLCRRPYGDGDFDFDALATHSDADWMTQPECADQEMWLYEWTDGNLSTDPTKYVVHRAIGTGWDYGNNYLILSETDNTYGIGVKARVHGGGTCHEADAFLVLNRDDYSFTSRGWSWACGTGHTLFNRPVYNPFLERYAAMCGTDWNADEQAWLADLWMRIEDSGAIPFHRVNYQGLRIKGGAGTVLPRDDGYLGIIVGIDGHVSSTDGIPLSPPTSIGLARFNSSAELQGVVRWVAATDSTYLSYPQLAELGPNRYLLGYGEMKRLADESDDSDDSYRIPWDYYLMEINADGTVLRAAQRLEGVGWGEQDQLVSLGNGRVAWAYIPDPSLVSSGEYPSCNSPNLQLTLYVAE